MYNSSQDKKIGEKNEQIIKMWMILAAIAVIGIILNLGLLIRSKFSIPRNSPTTRSSLYLLGTMAVADTLCLFSLLFLLCLRFFGLENHEIFLSFMCKLHVFIMHTTSSFSIWCWLVLSTIRYVAVYRPYTHLKMSTEPIMAVLTVAVFCSISEIWVLWDIEYDENYKSCGGPETEISRHLQIFEIFTSYFLPVVFITILDLKVLLCRKTWFTGYPAKLKKTSSKSYADRCSIDSSSFKIPNGSDSSKIMRSRSACEFMTRNSTRIKRRQQLRVLRRCLCITIFDLSMNLPSYLLRLYLSLVDENNLIDIGTIVIIEEISQVMYFAQFSLNALYLVCIIYDTPRKKVLVPSTRLSAVGITPRASYRRSHPFTTTPPSSPAIYE